MAKFGLYLIYPWYSGGSQVVESVRLFDQRRALRRAVISDDIIKFFSSLSSCPIDIVTLNHAHTPTAKTMHALRSLLSLLVATAAHARASLQCDVPTRATFGEWATVVKPHCFTGTQFPPVSEWLPYPDLFGIQTFAMAFGHNTQGEIRAINESVQAVATSSGIDP